MSVLLLLCCLIYLSLICELGKKKSFRFEVFEKQDLTSVTSESRGSESRKGAVRESILSGRVAMTFFSCVATKERRETREESRLTPQPPPE